MVQQADNFRSKEIDANFAYLFLYAVEPEQTLDPNNPNHEALCRRMREKHAQDLLQLIQGSARPLFKKWGEKLRNMNIALLTDLRYTMEGDKNCSCNACILIRDMRQLLSLCSEAEAHFRSSKK